MNLQSDNKQSTPSALSKLKQNTAQAMQTVTETPYQPIVYAIPKEDFKALLEFIMLSCLAFFAMSMHYSINNTKPVSIHKVFGGSTSSELKRCLSRYFRIMLPSLALGIPLAWFVSGRYLEQFSYRIDLKENIWIFLTAMLISLSISIAAVLWQTIRAARTNPAEALKKE